MPKNGLSMEEIDIEHGRSRQRVILQVALHKHLIPMILLASRAPLIGLYHQRTAEAGCFITIGW